MSPEKEKRRDTESWTIKVKGEGPEGANTKKVNIRRNSKNPISQFVISSLEVIDTRLEKLNIPVKKIKSYGVRRPTREIRDINKQREAVKGKLEAASKVLKGNTDQVIEFLRDNEGSIAGFRIANLNGTKKS